MTHSFEKDYWERHWDQAHDAASASTEAGPNPHLGREVAGLAPGTALDAGCGTGADAIWLAGHGWRVTAADISATALDGAAARAAGAAVAEWVTWLEADLTTWLPTGRFDLVATSYAHPAMSQLAFYERVSDWVAPGGTLLIVGHLRVPADNDGVPGHGDAPGHTHDHGHGHGEGAGDLPPAEATITLADITGRLDPAVWRIETAEEHTRSVTGPGGSRPPPARRRRAGHPARLSGDRAGSRALPVPGGPERHRLQSNTCSTVGCRRRIEVRADDGAPRSAR